MKLLFNYFNDCVLEAMEQFVLITAFGKEIVENVFENSIVGFPDLWYYAVDCENANDTALFSRTDSFPTNKDLALKGDHGTLWYGQL